MKIMGMGFPELVSLLPLLALGAGVYALVAFIRSRKVAVASSGNAQTQNSQKEKYVRRAIVGVSIALVCIALSGFHVCEDCGKMFYGKTYASYYYSVMCPDCARYSTPGILS
ncbi:hypothetical protein [Eggerthella sinensis]|uniref:hypothetical protein n=1 Tax=Eggerthella sinensis TaxID=242230 RepID=UPI0022E320AA|nr:hypothetical protein [Eggerthella sinensis]